MRTKQALNNALQAQSERHFTGLVEQQVRTAEEINQKLAQLIEQANEKVEEVREAPGGDAIAPVLLLMVDAIQTVSDQVQASNRQVIDAVKSIKIPEAPKAASKPNYDFEVKRDKSGKITKVEAKAIG